MKHAANIMYCREFDYKKGSVELMVHNGNQQLLAMDAYNAGCLSHLLGEPCSATLFHYCDQGYIAGDVQHLNDFDYPYQRTSDVFDGAVA